MTIKTLWATLIVSLLCLGSFAQSISAGHASAEKLTFEIYQDAGGEYRWRLKAGNGEILATPGQSFKTKASCQESVERLKKNAGSDKAKFETYEDNKQNHRWRMVASNGQTVASSSQGYKAKADCQKAVELIKKEAKNAAVEVMP